MHFRYGFAGVFSDWTGWMEPSSASMTSPSSSSADCITCGANALLVVTGFSAAASAASFVACCMAWSFACTSGSMAAPSSGFEDQLKARLIDASRFEKDEERFGAPKDVAFGVCAAPAAFG